MRTLRFDGRWDGWRLAARSALAAGLAPNDVAWSADDDPQTLLLGDAAPDVEPAAELRVPRRFLLLSRAVACHRDAERWGLLYRALWRLTRDEPSLLDVATDPDVHRLLMMEKAVRRDVHKMHAFVRFRVVRADDGEPAYAAWFEPEHRVVERAAPFFARRFESMRWSILTPERCAHWDRAALRFTPGLSRRDAPAEDAAEALWLTYYASVFNPARLSLGTMRAEMPKRYWVNLPEARLVAPLAREAPRRVAEMLERARAAPAPIPAELAARPVAPTIPPALALPNAWDPAHDPGVVEARRRDAEVPHDAPLGLVLDGARVAHGVAGWTDPTLLAPGVFYPSDATTPEARLRHYASRYPMVEVDATYYALPSRAVAAAWAARTPAAFSFDVKAFALMTGHAADLRRLPDWLRRALPRTVTARGDARVRSADVPDELRVEMWRRFLDALEPLRSAGKLGAVYLQFPRWFEPSRAAAAWLRRARERLGDVDGAVEFRNPAWVEGRTAARTFGLLRELELAYTAVDAPPGTRSSMPPVVAVTSPRLVVVRLHGRRTATWEARNDPVSERYRYLYDAAQLAEWVPRVRDAIGLARSAGALPSVRLSFNNNHGNYGAVNARELAAMLVDAGATALGGAPLTPRAAPSSGRPGSP